MRVHVDVSSDVLSKFAEYINWYYETHPDDISPLCNGDLAAFLEWENDFLQGERARNVSEIANFADAIEMTRLREVCAVFLAKMIRGKTREQIYDIFEIPYRSRFSAEEIQQIREEMDALNELDNE